MSGKFGPETSQSGRESLAIPVYTKPRVPTTRHAMRSGRAHSAHSTGQIGAVSNGNIHYGNSEGGSCTAGSCGAELVAFIGAICTNPAFGVSLAGADAAAGGAGCIG